MSSPQDGSAEASPSTPLHRPNRTLWQRLGGEGLALSIIIHLFLVIIAVIWVVSTVTDLSGKKDPNAFATGAFKNSALVAVSTGLLQGMTREEIGSYLGLKLETVSRTFSKFVEDGIVEVKQRHVRIMNADALKDIVNPKVCE